MDGILVIALARLGDLAQCFPAFSDLNRLTGGQGIALLVQKDLEPVARLHPSAREIIPFDGDVLLGSIKEEGSWSQEGLNYLNELWDKIEKLNPRLIVNLTHTAFSGMLCRVAGVPEVRGRTYHQGAGQALCGDWTRYFFTLLSSRSCNAINLVDVNREISGGSRGDLNCLRIPDEDRRFAGETLKGLTGKYKVAMGIGAHHPLRRWPGELWGEAALILKQRCDADIILLGGSDEERTAAAIAESCGDRCLNLCGATDLTQLCAVIEQCDLFIGHDSGPLHLSAMMNKPCLGLYLAMASAWETAPYSAGAVSIEPDVSCHPCSEKGGCTDPQCHRKITPEAVAGAAEHLLQRESPGAYEDCLVRISDLDADGWLTLEGGSKPGDDLRRAWRGFLNFILNPGTLKRGASNPTYSLNAFAPMWDTKLEHLTTAVLQLIHQTMDDVRNQTEDFLRSYRDPISREIPELIAKHPEFRPLLDLYHLDCVYADGLPLKSHLENILTAQNNLLRRISIIQQMGPRAQRPGIKGADEVVFYRNPELEVPRVSP